MHCHSLLKRPITHPFIAAAFCLFGLAGNRVLADPIPQSVGPLGLPQVLAAPGAPPNELSFGHASSLSVPPDQPHPAVARIVVPEGNATSYGSGTLVDVRGMYGLVITNWHVVRDGHGEAEVIFPDGFRSPARPLKVDADWDLAALVIWRPRVAPVKIAANAPQPGDQLTICGYGSGRYRSLTGRCTQYYSPKVNLPQHMVELDVEARQGDSGGPIFNGRGELAGVLFGAGHGTTLGSFGGRVGWFLATLAPDIGRANEQMLAAAAPNGSKTSAAPPIVSSDSSGVVNLVESSPETPIAQAPTDNKALANTAVASSRKAKPKSQPELPNDGWHAVVSKKQAAAKPVSVREPVPIAWDAPIGSILAAVGVLAVAMQLVRAAR